MRRDILNSLRTTLLEGDLFERSNVLNLLGTMRATEMVDEIIAAIDDEEVEVGVEALETLTLIAPEDMTEALIERLKREPEADLRKALIHSITASGGANRKVTELLRDILADQPEHRSWIGDREQYWDMRMAAIQVAAEMRLQECVPPLSMMLDDPRNEQIIDLLLKVLAEIGGQGLNSLKEILEQGDSERRRRVMDALTHSREPESLRMLAEGLFDADSMVRVATLNALACRQASMLLKLVLVYLRDPDRDVVQASLDALPHITQERIEISLLEEKLRPLIEDQDARIRIAVLDIIAHATPTEVSAELKGKVRNLLTDKRANVAAAATKTVAYLADTLAIPLLLDNLHNRELYPVVREESIRAVAQMVEHDPHIAAELQKILTDTDQDVAVVALEALHQIEVGLIPSVEEMGSLVHRLLPLTQSDCRKLKERSIDLLGSTGHHSAVSTLQSLLHEDDQRLQLEASKALLQIARKDISLVERHSVENRLYHLIQNIEGESGGSPSLLRHALELLSHLNPDAFVSRCGGWLSSTNIELQIATLEQLGELFDRETALDSYNHLEEVVPQIVEYLASSDPDLRYEAAHLLKRFLEYERLQSLVKTQQDQIYSKLQEFAEDNPPDQSAEAGKWLAMLIPQLGQERVLLQIQQGESSQQRCVFMNLLNEILSNLEADQQAI